MSIEIQGLTPAEMVFCSILWEMQSQEDLNMFLSSLPNNERKLCESLMQLMTLAAMDNVETTDEAQEVLSQFRI